MPPSSCHVPPSDKTNKLWVYVRYRDRTYKKSFSKLKLRPCVSMYVHCNPLKQARLLGGPKESWVSSSGEDIEDSLCNTSISKAESYFAALLIPSYQPPPKSVVPFAAALKGHIQRYQSASAQRPSDQLSICFIIAPWVMIWDTGRPFSLFCGDMCVSQNEQLPTD